MSQGLQWGKLVLGFLFFVLVSIAVFLMYDRSLSIHLSGIPGNEEERGITVIGEGEVEAIPDVARFTVTVKSSGDEVSDVQNNSSENINEVISFLKGEGIEDADIKTTLFDISPQYRFEDGRRIPEGYEAIQTIQVTVDKLDRVGDLIASVSNLKVDDVGSLFFEIGNADELADQARELAIEDARNRAERLVEVAGGRIGGVISIKETGSATPLPFAQLETASRDVEDAVVSPNIEPGEQQIVQNIEVTFEIIN